MKGLLIFLAIYLIEVIVQKVREKKQQKMEEAERQAAPPPAASNESSSANRNLQDLIRQFENSQRQASQGNIEPPLPSRRDYDEVELTVVEPKNPGHYTFMEIAQSVIQWEYVSVDLLMQAFSFNENTATQVLRDLQAKRICGNSVGDDECDLLVHNMDELENLLKRQQREAEARNAQAELQKRREAELEHQRALAELEERARQMREQTAQSNGLPEADQTASAPCLATSGHAAHRRTFDRSEIRRGFVWAKVLDEPRFRKKWSTRAR